MKKLFVVMILVMASALTGVRGQIIVEHESTENVTDSVRRAFDNGPYFTLYKDNYFTVGMPLGPKITPQNSGVKFQISIAQRITKSVLPWHTYLFLMYTQKTFWNVFENSLPMHDLNFNPGIGITKPFFSKDRYIGKLTLMVEHESNGRDGPDSRSWNRVSFSGSVIIDQHLMVHGKVWIPIIDGMNNKDILNYCGIFQTGVQARTSNNRFQFGLTVVKRKGWNFNANTIVDVSWRPWKNSNQFLFLQYYNGYGESLLDYNQYHSNIYVGFVIKPNLFSEF